jgi:hypothetical protein
MHSKFAKSIIMTKLLFLINISVGIKQAEFYADSKFFDSLIVIGKKKEKVKNPKIPILVCQ